MAKVGGLLILVIVLVISVADYMLSRTDEGTIKVVGMPPQANHAFQSPYVGPHPSQLTRPAETFPFPIRLGQVGPVDPLFAGELQYPFLCAVQESRLGQPIIDNHQGWGMPVFDLDKTGSLTKTVIGYSKDCLVPTTARYYYKPIGSEDFLPLSNANNDIEKIWVNGKQVDFIVRLEMGVINRFIYMIAVLKGQDETLALPNASHWNKKLIYQFRGGVGIGYRQGKIRPNVVFNRRAQELAQGYAVVYSSGTQTSNHYNMWVSEEVALRVKRQFIALYGQPEYTVGIGGSGGAIQQYLIAQNNPGVLDAIIAEYSYPDMVTQTTYVLDCELLEYYFDVKDRDNHRWQNWPNRQVIQGMNANENKSDFRWLRWISQLKVGQMPSWSNGETECVNGWRGLTPLVHNPQFFHKKKYFSDEIYKRVRWTHWTDLKDFYGADAEGYGKSAWDNVGVQYGLTALQNGDIRIEEFMDMNASIGGWKPSQKMHKERFWFWGGNGLFPLRLSVWSHQNMELGTLENPANRSQGSLAAIEASYRSGHVFMGKLDLPIIDVRHYLEDELDMHHLAASFSIRKRMLREQGHADNQVIWVSHKPHNPEPLAFEVIDQWMHNQQKYPERSVADNKPSRAIDRCFDKDGLLIAEGESVWDGQWNQQSSGACTTVYPSYNVSREIAGADVAGDILKCHLQTVDDAMAKGVYGAVDMTPFRKQLQHIFPQGVCDYTLGDAGRPGDLFSSALSRSALKDPAAARSKAKPLDSAPSDDKGVIEVSLDENNNSPRQLN